MGDGENFVSGRTRPCSKCKGEGTQRCVDCGGSGIFSSWRCTTCNGRGTASEKAVAKWEQEQELERKRKLLIEKERQKLAEAAAAMVRKSEATKVVQPTAPVPQTVGSSSTSSNSVLGGIIGALLGWVFLYASMHFVNSIMGSGNLFVSLVAVLVAIANFIGFFAYPIIGFKLGAKYIFTTKRTVVTGGAGPQKPQETIDLNQQQGRAATPSSESDARLDVIRGTSKERELKAWEDSEIESRIRYGEYLASLIAGVWLGVVSSWWVGLFAAVVVVGLGELIIVSNRPS